MITNKTIKKHLFFISKGLNWHLIPPEDQAKYTFNYILKTCKQTNRLQDWQRLNYQKQTKTTLEYLNNAIQAKAIN